MLYSDATPKTYMASGPAYPGEDVHVAMGENTAYSLAGHLLSRPAPGIGHGFEDEPVDQAERDSQHVAQNVARDAVQNEDDQQAPAFDHAAVASSIRQALRPGGFGATA